MTGWKQTYFLLLSPDSLFVRNMTNLYFQQIVRCVLCICRVMGIAMLLIIFTFVPVFHGRFQFVI